MKKSVSKFAHKHENVPCQNLHIQSVDTSQTITVYDIIISKSYTSTEQDRKEERWVTFCMVGKQMQLTTFFLS